MKTAQGTSRRRWSGWQDAGLVLVLLAAGAATLAATEKAAEPIGFFGMHCGNDTNVAKAAPVLKDLGVTWVRLWCDMNWTDQKEGKAFALGRDFKAAGFKVILLLQCPSVPDPKAVREYCDWVQKAPGMKDAVDIWEILNEINQTKYWQGTPAEYVEKVLKPAYESLHTGGETVLGGSCTAWQDGKWGTSVTQALKDAGYLSYCDYAGTHPYTNKVVEMKDHVAAVRRIFAGKPLIATEWNFKRVADNAKWKAMLDEVLPFCRENLAIACHYRLIGMKGEGGWPGVVTSKGEPQQPFYDMYKTWTKGDLKAGAASTSGGAPATRGKGKS